MVETVRLGVIGAGNFTRNRLLPNFLKIPGVEVAAVANRTLESSERVAAEFSIASPMADWHDLVARDDLDAIVVGTQPYFHHEAVMAALEAGKHVLCQTRMATSLHEAREMSAKAEEKHLKGVLVRSGAYQAVHRYVKHLLDEGYLGQVRQVFAYYLVANYADSTALLHRRQDHRNFGVINPMALGIYWDVLRPWFGDAERVFAWGKVFTPQRPENPGGPLLEIELPDAITVIAEMAGGPVVTCIQSGVALFGNERIEIFGEDGTLVCPAQGELLAGRKGDKALSALPVPEGYKDYWHVEEDFIRLVRGEDVPQSLTFADGVKNIELLEASHVSVVEGRWVGLALPEEINFPAAHLSAANKPR
jgi:predicted dehydrogenase